MSEGFHTIKRDSEHRLRVREAFDPQKHRREALDAWQAARRKRRRTVWVAGAAAALAGTFALAWEPSAAWRAERAADDLSKAEADRETRRLRLASDEAFRRESLVSDGRAAIVVNSQIVAPLVEPLDEPFSQYAGRTYARQLLRHGAVAEFLHNCGRTLARESYLARNADVRMAQFDLRERTGAEPLPPLRPSHEPVPGRCGEVAELAEAGLFDLRLD